MLAGGCFVVPNPQYQGIEATSDVEASSSGAVEGSPTGRAGDDSSTTGADGSTTSTTSAADGATSSEGGGTPTVLACGENELESEEPCPAACDACVEEACVFSCVTEEACKQRVLSCPVGRSCVVECSAREACQQAFVICPSSSHCAVECEGERSCEKLDLVCGAGTCALACGEGPHVCEKARLVCGSNDSSVHCVEPQRDLQVHEAPISACACAADPSCE